MATYIEDIDLSQDTHTSHSVTINEDDVIYTVVTHTPSVVDHFISEILYIHRFRLNRLVVGLDVEWRPNFTPNVINPVALLQLCIGRRCLIFKLLYASEIPQSLVDFLDNPTYRFVGVGVDGDAEKLWRDYELNVANTVDLKDLAAEQLGMDWLYNAGLKDLAREVLDIEIEKRKKVTLSRWDNFSLSYDQITYACVDAFVSFEIGRRLIWGN